MKKDLIKNILTSAVYAPSGENSQPWRFEVKDNIIYQYNLPEKDNPVYNYRQRGSFFAHGSLLQNIILLAKAEGYNVEFELLPNEGEDDLVAKITLNESCKLFNPIVNFIKKRHTNRNKYKNNKLTKIQKDELQKIAYRFSSLELKIIESSSDKMKLSKIFSNNDRIMLEHKPLHNSVFGNICWNKEEETERKNGLYVKTMELSPPQLGIFKLLKNWKIAKIFKKIGMTKFIATENAKIYASGGAYLSIVITNNDVEYIKAGMLTQILWLQLTKFGLSAHPLAALPYLYDRINNTEKNEFNGKHIALIRDSYNVLRGVYKLQDKNSIAMTLRVGYSKPPSGTSSRLKPKIIFID